MLSSATLPVSPERLMQFTFGFAPPLMIETALRYGVFDILDKGAKSLDALCVETATSPRGLRMVLDALVGLDVLSKDDAGHYALTEESVTFLVIGKPTYHGAFFLLTKEPMLSSWAKLEETVRSGRPAHRINREQDGTSFFLKFVEDIFPIHYAAAQALATALGVQSTSVPISVLDLAAGSGVWSVAIAQQSPQIRVTAVDWPGVIPVTKKVSAHYGLADRYTFVAGDLHDANFGQGHIQLRRSGTFFIAKARAVVGGLLGKTFEALAPGGTIAIATTSSNLTGACAGRSAGFWSIGHQSACSRVLVPSIDSREQVSAGHICGYPHQDTDNSNAAQVPSGLTTAL